MKFSCDRCHKKFTTTDEPVPGRVYRIPCKCGNTIVVQIEAAAERAPAPASVARPRAEPRRATPPPIPSPVPAAAPHAPGQPAVVAAWSETSAIADDPFVRAQRRATPDLGVLLACASEEVTPTVLQAPLATRDPDAPPELSTAYDPAPSDDPFTAELRRTRTHALALGGAAGAAFGAFLAAAVTLVLVRPWSPAAADTLDGRAVPAALLASHRTGDRQLARRKPIGIRAGASPVAAAPAALAAVPVVPPSPAPAARAEPAPREDVSRVAAAARVTEREPADPAVTAQLPATGAGEPRGAAERAAPAEHASSAADPPAAADAPSAADESAPENPSAGEASSAQELTAGDPPPTEPAAAERAPAAPIAMGGSGSAQEDRAPAHREDRAP